LYHGHRFPAVVISCAVRWYFRFSLSLRDIEELLLERGVVVTYETIRCWCDKFGAGFAQCAKAARRKPGSTWHLDEMFVTLRGEPYLLWRAVDEHGMELDVLVQKRRDKAAAKRSSGGAAFKPGAAQDRYRPAAQLSRRRRLTFPSSLM
jgi:putative transposase